MLILPNASAKVLDPDARRDDDRTSRSPHSVRACAVTEHGPRSRAAVSCSWVLVCRSDTLQDHQASFLEDSPMRVDALAEVERPT
ncbi:hypothetical protein PsYK624_033140 [Phanerochaete sordida]|uniref:Uncharacterized protein n=1 Tax=Phanerochaete sordida TaxID=48140 RepID=A0A9P3G2T5_9APHY|nr:hypothetical protein PsYK624_033140 [Phanerochaete sordida]